MSEAMSRIQESLRAGENMEIQFIDKKMSKLHTISYKVEAPFEYTDANGIRWVRADRIKVDA
jgi:hypothetical protein